MPRHNADTTVFTELRRRHDDDVEFPASVFGMNFTFSNAILLCNLVYIYIAYVYKFIYEEQLGLSVLELGQKVKDRHAFHFTDFRIRLHVTFRSWQNLVLLLYGSQVASADIFHLCNYAIFIHDLVSNDSNNVCIISLMGLTATAEISALLFIVYHLKRHREGGNYNPDKLLFSNCSPTVVFLTFNAYNDVGTSCAWSR